MSAKLSVMVLLLLAPVAVFADQTSLRGVNPEFASRYESADGILICDEGRKKLPISRVNDQYCDCYDGTDEPGTAACPTGTFYCANVGHWPLVLNSSFVDDGICDCCDGTDEPEGRCTNKCKELGASALKALKAQLSSVEAGLKKRGQYQRTARRNKKTWTARLDEIGDTVTDAEKRSEAAATVKQSFEEQERKLLKTKTNIEAALEPPPPPVEEQEEEDAVEEDTEDGEEFETEDDTAADEDLENEAEEALEEEVAEEEETEEERAKRVAAQWIPGANKGKGEAEHEENEHVAGEGEGEGDNEEGSEGEEEEGVNEEERNLPAQDSVEEDGDLTVALSFADRVARQMAIWGTRLAGKSKERAELAGTDAVLKLVQKRLNRARNTHNQASTAFNKLQTEKTDLENKLKHDFGPNEVFAGLLGNCYETNVDKYKYKICPFGDAHQDHTSLGHWGGFDNNYTIMKFTGGSNCWSGPDRSMTVTVKCGRTEVLTKVAEPSRCEYSSELATPAACSEELAEELRQEIAARESGVPIQRPSHEELR